jgi:hypothetical protein
MAHWRPGLPDRPQQSRLVRRSSRDPVDTGSKLCQFSVEPLVPAVEMTDCTDDRLAAGGQSGQDQRGAGSQIRGRHPGAAQTRHAGDPGGPFARLNPCAQPSQLRHVHESGREDPVADRALPRRQRKQGHPLGLKVGGNARVRQSGDVDGSRRAVRGKLHSIFGGSDLQPGRTELGQHGVEVFRHDSGDGHGTSRRGGRQQQRGRFDAIGHHAVGGAAHLIDAPDAKRRRPQARDARPYPIEKPAQVDDLRLHRGAEDGGLAFGQDGGAHHVRRAGDRGTPRTTERDRRADQASGAGDHTATLDPEVRPQGGQSLQVQVDGPGADVAPAGERDHGPAAPGQQRPQHAEAGAHPPDPLVTGADRPPIHRLQERRAVGRSHHLKAQFAQHQRHGVDVSQPRHALQADRFGREDGGGHHRQRRVFRAAGTDGPRKRSSAADPETVAGHVSPSDTPLHSRVTSSSLEPLAAAVRGP